MDGRGKLKLAATHERLVAVDSFVVNRNLNTTTKDGEQPKSGLRTTSPDRVRIPCDSLVDVEAKVADTASGRDWNAVKSDGWARSLHLDDKAWRNTSEDTRGRRETEERDFRRVHELKMQCEERGGCGTFPGRAGATAHPAAAMDTTLILLVAALVASPCRSQSPGPEDDSASTTTAAAPTTAQRPLEGVLPKEVSKGVLNTLTGQPVLDGVKGLMEAAGLPASNTTLNDLKETLVKSGLSILEKANNNRKSLFKGVGAQCSFDAECSASFSTCSGNKCTCKQDYIVSTDSATCLPGQYCTPYPNRIPTHMKTVPPHQGWK
ncbi:hypothetical protein AAG570_003323 [Ranatra chinensis]|uniref:Uncharacterized protein n=1 Tax=Ranatra chinensis TaxID=642074 RepID=A0ABD0YUX0_9HEMI